MQAQTIAQIKAQDPESLWHFLSGLPASQEAQIFYALMLAGTLGMFASYGVKWAKGEISGDLFQYLFKSSMRATALSLFTYTGTALGAIYAGAFYVTDGGIFVGWGMVLWLGAINGFSIDAIVNKGERPVWTAEQRSTRAGGKDGR